MNYEFDFLMYNETSFVSAPYWEFRGEKYEMPILEILKMLQNEGWEVVCPSHHKDRNGYLMKIKSV